MTKKWDDPQLDAAPIRIDRFWNAKQTVSEQMAEIYQSIREKIFASNTSPLANEVEDVMGRLLARKQMPGS
jgi:hypothetical protein